MKIAGKKIDSVNTEIIAIPRHDGDIIFIAKGVQDMSEFLTLCPQPKAPEMYKRIEGRMEKVPDFKDVGYISRIHTWSERKTNWLILKSLEATPGGIEWETIDMSKPDTWGNLDKELRDAGFNEHEILRIINGAIAANGLNDQRVEEAKARFLLGEQGCNEEQNCQKVELTNTLSGEPAKEQDSKFDRQGTKK